MAQSRDGAKNPYNMGFWHCLSILAPLRSVAIEIEGSARAPYTKMAAGKKTLEALSNRLLELDSAIEEPNNSRFRGVSDSETYEFVKNTKNQNTQMKTNSDLKKIHSWLESVGELPKVESIPSKDLDLYLARFFLSAKKKNDKEYEPDTLEAYQASPHQYLAHKQYRGNIL